MDPCIATEFSIFIYPVSETPPSCPPADYTRFDVDYGMS